MDGEADTEVDLGSYAYQIWKNAIDADPALEKTIPDLPNVVYSTKRTARRPGDSRRACSPTSARPKATTPSPGWTAEGTPSPSRSSPSCGPPSASRTTPGLPRHENHHDLVRKAVELIAEEEKTVGGQLGRPSRRPVPDLRAAEALSPTR